MWGEERFVYKHPIGRKITYKVVGDEDDRPFIFFHGWGSAASSVFWDSDFLMMNNICIIIVNRPGYGGSELEKNYTMCDYAADVKYVLDHLNIKKAGFIGWSNGGLYCQVFAYQYPHYISSLSLAASAIPLRSKESAKVLPFRWKIIKKLNSIAPFLNRKYAGRVNKKWTGYIGRKALELLNTFKQEGCTTEMKEQLKKQTAAGIRDAYRTKGWAEYFELHAMMRPFELKKWKTPFPVYLWCGEDDNLWPAETTAFLQEKYQGSEMQVVKGKGHFFFLVCWEEIVKKAMSVE